MALGRCGGVWPAGDDRTSLGAACHVSGRSHARSAHHSEYARECQGPGGSSRRALLCGRQRNPCVGRPLVRSMPASNGSSKGFSDAVKAEDAGALATYVNFPTTEYLDLPFLDFLAFNVYLETKDSLQSYLARLQNLAGERPLVMAELGLDSRRNGEARRPNRSIGRSRRRSKPAAAAPLCMPGPTSGSAAVTMSQTGISDLQHGIASPSRRCFRSQPGLRTRPFRPIIGGRGSR